ncbi:MAG: hypothetical protein A2Z91_07330 [Deltaproteobacteria bacterium GWA2_38_16]|nr:MAG: hypothetical protein A2Z91_07330 [Deltaproteobacteria bacterium GWA2_38_16]OGQ02719.1 MAG: hypothetical protein A3D19_00665 [Deltaproteobacteria bacterium RIFCSPHIGHO2_02_FULL_38_15]OGQ33617.1 MAG: hypothetical protein A3A72_01895 [Deltaproteobacteria bacterium RIFCSPLOWO2_01_FULL_38_9]HBQ20579.1 hypothetical protein [Deltaproteobacteria bacterium]
MNTKNLYKAGRMMAILSLIIVFGGAWKCNWLNPKIKLPNVKVTFGDPVTLSLPLSGQEITVGAKLDVPDLEGAFVELIPQIGNVPATVFLSVPAKVFDNPAFRLRDPGTLPGGRPLPKVAEGKLPAVALEVPQWNNIVFYLGLEVAGLFAPTTGKEPDVQLTLPISDNSGRNIGFITRIPQENGANGGYFVSFNWNLATTNPGEAIIHRSDLANASIEGIPYDLSEVFETSE